MLLQYQPRMFILKISHVIYDMGLFLVCHPVSFADLDSRADAETHKNPEAQEDLISASSLTLFLKQKAIRQLYRQKNEAFCLPS